MPPHARAGGVGRGHRFAADPPCWADHPGEREAVEDDLMFRHAWILFIAVMCANAAVWWTRARKVIADKPELESGYRSLIRGWLIYGNIPWLVMGYGMLFGRVTSIEQYLHPQSNPHVLAWYGSVVAIWVLTAYWIFLRGGAEALIRHPGLLNLPTQEPWVVKAVVALTLAGGVIGLAMVFLGHAPVRR